MTWSEPTRFLNEWPLSPQPTALAPYVLSTKFLLNVTRIVVVSSLVVQVMRLLTSGCSFPEKHCSWESPAATKGATTKARVAAAKAASAVRCSCFSDIIPSPDFFRPARHLQVSLT